MMEMWRQTMRRQNVASGANVVAPMWRQTMRRQNVASGANVVAPPK